MSQRKQTRKSRFFNRLKHGLTRTAKPKVHDIYVNSSSGAINDIKDIKSDRIKNLYKEKDTIKQTEMIIKLANRLTRTDDSIDNYKNTLNEIIKLVSDRARLDMLNDNNATNKNFRQLKNERNSKKKKTSLKTGQLVHPDNVKLYIYQS